MNVPLVSVIIVNWNGAAYLNSCLLSLSQQSYSHIETIIIDNVSTDNSLQVIEAFYSQHPDMQIQVVRNTTNQGFCRGNNQGIIRSTGEFILLLNADVTLNSNFIAALVDVMRSDPAVGIVLGKLVSGYDHSRIDSTGIQMYKNRRAVDRGQGEEDRGQYALQEEVFGASGATCLYRRIMLEEIKYSSAEYLDELFFAYKEDVDLSWRARLCGWECMYTPQAVGQHFRKWGTGKRKDIPKWIRQHSLKNRYLMLLKNERWDTLFPCIFHIICFELLSIGYIIFREPYLLTVFGKICKMWPEVMRKRRMILKTDKRTPAKNLLPWFY